VITNLETANDVGMVNGLTAFCRYRTEVKICIPSAVDHAAAERSLVDRRSSFEAYE